MSSPARSSTSRRRASMLALGDASRSSRSTAAARARRAGAGDEPLRASSGSTGSWAAEVACPSTPSCRLHDPPAAGRLTREQGALVEPIAVGLRAVRRAGFARSEARGDGRGADRRGHRAVPQGARCGADHRREVSQARKRKALEVGADTVIDPGEEDVVARVSELTGGEGPSIPSTPPVSADARRRSARHPPGGTSRSSRSGRGRSSSPERPRPERAERARHDLLPAARTSRTRS